MWTFLCLELVYSAEPREAYVCIYIYIYRHSRRFRHSKRLYFGLRLAKLCKDKAKLPKFCYLFDKSIYVNMITGQRELRDIVYHGLPCQSIVDQGTARLSVVGDCAGCRTRVFSWYLYKYIKHFITVFNFIRDAEYPFISLFFFLFRMFSTWRYLIWW